MLKKLIILLILSSFVVAQLPDIPPVGPGGCVAIPGPDGKPLPCNGGGAVIPDPVVPVQPKEPDPIKPVDNGFIPGNPAPECKWECTAWTPNDENCRGGYQERVCNCTCDTCEGKEGNRKLCPTSQEGYPNIPPKLGTYVYKNPKNGRILISTRGEYYADYVDFHLRETDGKLYLISSGGTHIGGVGLHVGEPDARLKISTEPAPIVGEKRITAGKYMGEIKVDFADTTVNQTEDGFEIGFNVKKRLQPGKKEMTLDVLRDGQLVESIPLSVDLQPARRTFLQETKKRTAKPSEPEPNFVLFPTVAGYITAVAVVAAIVGLIAFMIRKRKTAWGKMSVVFGIFGIFFLTTPVGWPFAIAAIIFSRVQKKRLPTKIATTGLVLGIIGLVINLIVML